MNSVLERTEQLEQELTPEPLKGPAAGAILLHGLLLAALVSYGLISGLFKHNLWGNPGSGGAMQVTLVSSSIPLPNNQPVNQNVLSTETPSPAPPPPSPKEQHQVDETAIPIQGKKVTPKKQTTPKTPQHQPPPPQNRAQYGELNGTNIPHATQPQVGSNGPTTVGDNNFASRFGWYVNQINSKMSTTWNRFEVDQRTPRGSRVYIVFSISRDGSPGRVQLDRSSGSPTLDTSCLRAAQRVDTFGALPSAYNQSTLMVQYYCEY
ncbi:MAG TPA: TonB family protein [Terracidiphilus sp.]|jgi:periplasmic protein TonB|nr:TonB family protein [Terracidiphilus sp.]